MYEHYKMLSTNDIDFIKIVTFSSFFLRYYEFDAAVIRELLGKKLSSRNRKDLDDVSEKTKVPLKSCRRQVQV